jgi:hypothetical protein
MAQKMSDILISVLKLTQIADPNPGDCRCSKLSNSKAKEAVNRFRCVRSAVFRSLYFSFTLKVVLTISALRGFVKPLPTSHQNLLTL